MQAFHYLLLLLRSCASVLFLDFSDIVCEMAGAISHNVREIQKRAEATGCKLMGIIKADAYGHGAIAVSHMLHACNGLDAFGVATLDEAIELRESGLPLSVRVLVLGATHPSEWSHYSHYNLDVMINSAQQADALIEWSTREHAAGRLDWPMRAHIMLNTGMSRDGLETFSKEDIHQDSCTKTFGSSGNQQTYHGVCPLAAAQVVQRVANVDNSILEFVAICTHMCDAKKGSDYTVLQFRRACAVVEEVRRLGVAVPCIHLENSESLLADCIPDDDFRALLRGNPPGTPQTIGYARSGGGMYGQRNHSFLKPAITVRAQIRHVHVADKGVPVGYDRSWVAPDDVVIATLALGFADGYSRSNSNTVVGYGKGATVVIGGTKCVVAGKVCMDL
jgi:alanine racemase